MLKKVFWFFAYIKTITHHQAVKDSFDVARLLNKSQNIQDKDDADLTEQCKLRKLPRDQVQGCQDCYADGFL